jgi:translation elongation factor EF-Ts
MTADDVRELRDRTGAGLMQCKEALERYPGDPYRAQAWLGTRGLTVYFKSREARERWELACVESGAKALREAEEKAR